MRVILVDDEPIALEVIEASLSIYDEIQIVGRFTDPGQALENIKTLDPHVIFLDIEMGPANGLEIANNFLMQKNSIEIVFITAYSKYAIEAFEFNAIDYILKPPQKNRLDKTIERLRERFESEETTRQTINQLKVHSFGKFEVRDNTDKALKWRTQKTKELFALLLIGNKVSRDIILETIFPDKDLQKATTILHTTVYQLRRSLGKLGFKDNISYSNGEYELNLPMDCDFHKLDEILSLNNHSEENIMDLLNIYKGDFLEFEGYPWILSHQQEYKASIINILLSFTKAKLKANHRCLVIEDALKLLYKLDPYNEDVATIVIKYLGEQGHLDRLKKFFKQYKDNLWQELNVKPKDKTQNLYEKYC